MKSATKDKIYKSPVRRLARFFEKSRDRWKAKCREAKRTIKYFKNRVRFLEDSRDRWRSQAQELKVRVKQMEAKERELKGKLDALEPRVKKTVR